MFTLLIHFYNNAAVVRQHMTKLAEFSPSTLTQFKLLLVDDCSAPEEKVDFSAALVESNLDGLDLRVLKITDDIVWNQTGARNLGCYEAETDWIFCTDVDHYVDETAIRNIAAHVEGGGLSADLLYRVRRRNLKTGEEVSPHTNTFLVNRDSFISVGGYDEDFAGGAGHSDKFFFKLWSKGRKGTSTLDDVVVDVDSRASTKNMNRDMERNRTLYLSKVAGEIPENTRRINFDWRTDFVHAANSGLPSAPAVEASGQSAVSVDASSSTPNAASSSPEGEAVQAPQPTSLTEDQQVELFRTILADKRNFFSKTGWLNTVLSRRSVDAKGDPLPWFSYSFIHFLEGRLTSEMDVFEFGCGSSTLWFQQRVRSIVSCEHNRNWYNEMLARISGNAQLIFAPLGDDGEYSGQAAASKRKFDVIVVDGRQRTECARRSLEALSERGVFLWDNTNRDRYTEGFDSLAEAGFRRIEFRGLGPIANWETSTSVFYRPGNCFNI